VKTARMPVLFVGHGSPMNAIEDNEFSRGWARAAAEIPKPRAILCVSAHWLTRGAAVTAMKSPQTIHDFGGFPRELYDVSYPAPGAPEVADRAKEAAEPTPVGLDLDWGLDHGAWSVLRRMYPEADVPVVQFSIDIAEPGPYHYELGKRLAPLRDEGILIVGSGNVVHNLGMVAWEKMEGGTYGFDWALDFDAAVKERIETGRDGELADYGKLGPAAALAVPTPDHYYPLLYALGARDPAEPWVAFNEAPVGGSLTMTSYRFGA